MQAFDIARAGMTAAVQRLDASAARTASKGADADLANEAVEQIGAKDSFKANLAVMKTADDMLGQLLDMKT
ncbi:hypothetical protein BH11PSE2_BH11PSE2_18070 [soil metagenome]